MSSFTESNLLKKLTEVNQSQQSIQTLSLWLIHHRKHSKNIVESWQKEIKKAGNGTRKLTLLYLANDVIQNSKKKGPEFHREFRASLRDSFKYAARGADEKCKASMIRVINIWKERGVFDASFCDQCLKSLQDGSAEEPEKPSPPQEEEPQPDRLTTGEKLANKEKPSRPSKRSGPKPDTIKKKKKVELTLREEVELELAKKESVIVSPPVAEVLIRGLQELENSASSDAIVRERIAALPPEVSDVNLLNKLRDQEEGNRLSVTVGGACKLLADYNSRLADELTERKRVAQMLRRFILSQKEELDESAVRLQEYRSKLENVSGVRKELLSHMQSLPDLTLLPDVTGGLAPLPSAGDLFAAEQH